MTHKILTGIGAVCLMPVATVEVVFYLGCFFADYGFKVPHPAYSLAWALVAWIAAGWWTSRMYYHWFVSYHPWLRDVEDSLSRAEKLF